MTSPNFTVLTDDTLNDYRRRMVEALGDVEKAGLTLQDIRNMIYTKCLKVNPNIERNEEGEDKPKAAPRKKSIPGKTISGPSLDDLVG